MNNDKIMVMKNNYIDNKDDIDDIDDITDVLVSITSKMTLMTMVINSKFNHISICKESKHFSIF